MCKYVVFFVRKHEYIDIARRPNGLFKAYPYIVYKRYFIAFLHYKVKRNKFEGGGYHPVSCSNFCYGARSKRGLSGQIYKGKMVKKAKSFFFFLNFHLENHLIEKMS